MSAPAENATDKDGEKMIEMELTPALRELIAEWAREGHMGTAFAVDEPALLRRIRVALGKE